jgi:hypothetical protein
VALTFPRAENDVGESDVKISDETVPLEPFALAVLLSPNVNAPAVGAGGL